MKNIILLLIIPIISFSQNTRKVFVETGVSTFKPFVKEERIITGAEYQGSSDLKYTYKTTPGFFIKCGIEIQSKKERKFNITVPMSIGYKEFNKKVISDGYSYGCFSSFNGIEKRQTSSRAASIIISPKFNFNAEKLTVFTAINVNADLFFMYSESIEYKSTNGEIYSYYNSSKPIYNDFSLCASLQLGFDYRLSSRWTLGLSSDCYFYNFNPIIHGDKLNIQLFNLGHSKQSLFICSGIRAGYNF